MKYIININIKIDEELLNDSPEAPKRIAVKGVIIIKTTPAINESPRDSSLI